VSAVERSKRFSDVAKAIILCVLLSSNRRNMSPVAVSVYLPSSLMSSRIVGSAGVYFRLALYSHDLAELKVGMRCTTVFEMSSQIVVSELVTFLVYRWNWFHFICAASVDMIHYLFGDDSCMVCWVRVYLSAESNWYGVYS
jgi:hypothetical protein